MKSRVRLVAAALVAFVFESAQAQVGQQAASGTLQAAVSTGNAAAIRSMVTNAPGQAEYIASTLSQMARSMTSTNPQSAAFAMSQATSIAAMVVNRSPAVASQVAGTGIAVAEDPALIHANPGAVAQIATDAARIVAVPAVAQADRRTALSVAQRAQSVVLNMKVLPRSPRAAADVNESLSRVLKIVAATQSPQSADASRKWQEFKNRSEEEWEKVNQTEDQSPQPTPGINPGPTQARTSSGIAVPQR